MEEEALTSKSTELKPTEETEAMKQIVKEAERLSIEEKPHFKPASKIALAEDTEKKQDEADKKEEPAGMVDSQSKKRSYD